MTSPKSTQKITDKLEQKNEHLVHEYVKVLFKKWGDKWLTIAPGVSRHILNNAERFHYLFIDQEGKKDIVVLVDRFLEYVDGKFIGDCSKENALLSGTTDKRIKNDWTLFSGWMDRLEPVIAQFVSTYKADVDEKFCENKIRNNEIDPDNVSSGLVHVPFNLITAGGVTFKLSFAVGFFGTRQVIGWYISDESKTDEIKNMPKVTFIKFLQMKRALDLVVMDILFKHHRFEQITSPKSIQKTTDKLEQKNEHLGHEDVRAKNKYDVWLMVAEHFRCLFIDHEGKKDIAILANEFLEYVN
ncbi:8684_t:CDS:2 [Diversispora eburnea]|uniref:8684_t:CDS:1 n=1 Tax=Diversispora eburnea TaxID=1213867 RepID=A0A9N8VQP4_9GLOM|nr:8684_t:CDS:2 [Diversispora eburnea]